MDSSNKSYYFERMFAIVAAIILLQTLFFKFTAAPVSVHIFSTLGIESWGRIGTGIVELIAGGLLLYYKTSIYGAVLALGTMTGAILSHLIFLGIDVQNDGGNLFALALVVLMCCLGVLFIKRAELLSIIKNVLSLKN